MLIKFYSKSIIYKFFNYSNSHIDLLNPLNNFNDADIQNLYSLEAGLIKEIDLKNNWMTKLVFSTQMRNNDFENGRHGCISLASRSKSGHCLNA